MIWYAGLVDDDHVNCVINVYFHWYACMYVYVYVPMNVKTVKLVSLFLC